MADVAKLVSKADDAAGKRNYDYAIELYLQALTLDPDNGPARSSLRRVEIKKQNEVGGGGFVGKLFGFPSRIAAGIYGIGKNHEKQALAYESILKRDPTNTGVALKLARALYRSGAKRGARAVFEAVPEWDGACIEALKGAAAIAREQTQFEEALDLYQRAKAIHPNDKQVNDAIRDISAQRSIDVREGADSYRDMLEDESQAKELERRQKRALGVGDAASSAGEMEKALEQNPGDLPTLRRLARAYESGKKNEKAVETYKRILRIEPNDFDAGMRIAEIKLAAYDRRIVKLQSLVTADPNDANAKAELKKTRATRARFEVEDLAKRVASHPTETKLRFRYGVALHRSRKLNEAVAEFQQTRREPMHARDSAYWLGRCFLDLEKGQLAVKQFQSVLEKDDGGRLDAMAKDAHYYFGKALILMDDAPGARDHFERIYEEDINFRDVAKLVEGG